MHQQIDCVGLARSDMHYYKDGGIGSAVINGDFVPGHEFAARVVADDTGVFEPGQLLAVDPAKPCGVRFPTPTRWCYLDGCFRGGPSACCCCCRCASGVVAPTPTCVQR